MYPGKGRDGGRIDALKSLKEPTSFLNLIAETLMSGAARKPGVGPLNCTFWKE